MTKKTLLTVTSLEKSPATAADVRPVRSLRPMRSMNTRKSLRPAPAPVRMAYLNNSEAKQ